MADTSFFGRLTKLFRSQAIVTVDKEGKRKVFDADERQQTNLSSLRDRYTKVQKSFFEQAGGAQSMAYQQVRREVFRDYDAMDCDPILASALDIYADESTLKNEFGDVMKITSDNQQVQEILNNLFYDVLNVEFNLWPWVRNMCKYGDFFLGLEIAEGKGIVNVTPHSVYNTERLERIITSSIKQSNQFFIPKINPIISFSSFILNNDEEKIMANLKTDNKLRMNL